MENNRIKRLIICSLVLLITTTFVKPITVYGAWNNNAIDFVNQNGERHALYKENSFWFGQWGTSNGTIKYRIIGWQISVMVSGQRYIVNSKIGESTSVVDERFLSGTNKLYTLWKIDYNTITKKLKQKYPSVNFSELADRTVSSRYKFDAIMTTGIVQSDGSIKNQGAIDDNGNRTSGTVYYDVTGILNAASWTGSAPDDIRKLFDISSTVEGNQKPPINEEYAPINNSLSVISYDYKQSNNVYWVKPNKQFQIYTDGYIDSASLVYPDRNILNLFPGGNNNDFGAFATTSSGSNTSNFNNDFTLNSNSTRAWTEQASSRNYLKSNFYLSAKYDNKDYLLNYLSQWKGMNRDYTNSSIWIKTDGVAPSVSISANTSEWTKDILNVNIGVSDSRSGVDFFDVWLQKDWTGWNYKGKNISNLSLSESGQYDVIVQAYDKVGNKTDYVIKSYKVDRTNPYCSSVEIKNVTDVSYDVLIHGVADAHSGISKVRVPTWTDNNGEDDLKWYDAQNLGNGEWKYTVNTNQHNNEKGKYISHIYIYDNVGNYTVIGKEIYPIDVKVYTDYGNVFKVADNKELYTSADGTKWIKPNEEFYVTTKGHSEGYQINENQVQIYNINNTPEIQIAKASIPRDTVSSTNGGWQDAILNNTIKFNGAYMGNRYSVPRDRLNNGGTLNASGMHTEFAFKFKLTEDNKDYKQGSKMVSFGSYGAYYWSNGGNFLDYNTIKTDGTSPTGNVNYSFDENTLDLNISVNNIVEKRSGLNKIWVEYYLSENKDQIITEVLINDNGVYKGGKNLYNLFGESVDRIKARVMAIDNVGNEGVLAEKEFDPFTIKAEISRVLEPHDPIFKNGEKGFLKINVYGGVDKVKVTFPSELSTLDDSLDKEYILTPKKSDSIDQEFYIPLDAPSKEYMVQVKGFKNGREKIVYPKLTTNGSILNDIRTRILYNRK